MGLKINRGGGGEEKYFSSLFPNPPPFPTPPLSVFLFFLAFEDGGRDQCYSAKFLLKNICSTG